MGNFGQAALTIVGTIVGTYFGFPQLGFVLGSLVGQAVFPTQLPSATGPRLNDTKTTNAQLGGPVVELFGTDVVSGTVIFLGAVQEVAHTEDVGGKGGPEQEVTTFTYFQPIAFGLCRGPVTELIRVWENGKLVYDVRPQQPGESSQDYVDRTSQSNTYYEQFAFYTGTNNQYADPTIQQTKGVANTPAYRGLAYIVFHNRKLKEDQGLRHPNFKFEVTDL